MTWLLDPPPSAEIPADLRQRARALHRDAVVVDLHVDSILQNRLFRYDLRRRHRPTGWGAPMLNHADVPRLLLGGYSGAAMGLHYWPTEEEGGWAEIRRQIDVLERLAAVDDRVFVARSAADLRRAKGERRLALFPGCEGAHPLNGRLERVEALRRRGVRYLTLAHFSKNRAATPSLGRGADEVSGLTAWGKDLVAECNRVGLIVDVAHVNAPGVLDACRVSRRPVVATHTGFKAVRRHPRNLDDDGLRAIAATGGLAGLIFAPCFLADRLTADSRCVLDHLDHAVRLVGIDHVALGSDFDGMLPTLPADLRDCTDLWRITAGLLGRGYGEPDVRKILGENWLRVMASFDHS